MSCAIASTLFYACINTSNTHTLCNCAGLSQRIQGASYLVGITSTLSACQLTLPLHHARFVSERIPQHHLLPRPKLLLRHWKPRRLLPPLHWPHQRHQFSRRLRPVIRLHRLPIRHRHQALFRSQHQSKLRRGMKCVVKTEATSSTPTAHILKLLEPEASGIK